MAVPGTATCSVNLFLCASNINISAACCCFCWSNFCFFCLARAIRRQGRGLLSGTSEVDCFPMCSDCGMHPRTWFKPALEPLQWHTCWSSECLRLCEASAFSEFLLLISFSMWVWPRKFIVLENVGNVLAKDMTEVLEYLKQDFLPHKHDFWGCIELTVLFDFWHLLIVDAFCRCLSNHAGCSCSQPGHALGHDQWPHVWSACLDLKIYQDVLMSVVRLAMLAGTGVQYLIFLEH